MELSPGRRAAIDTRLAVLRPKKVKLSEERDFINKRCDRLEEARAKLGLRIKNHREFQSRVWNSLNAIDVMWFRGQNRSQIDDGYQAMHDQLLANRNRHQSNLSEIQSKMSTLTNQRTIVNQELTAATNEIANLERELRGY